MRDQAPKRPPRNNMKRVRGLTGMAMGVIYVAVGLFMIFALQENRLQLNPSLTYILAVFIIVYGLYRIWRGWQMRVNANKHN